MLRCSNGHLIDKCKERLHTWQGVVHRHKRCALCGADIDRDDRRWRCAEHCDYNVCDRCYKHRITARAGRTRQEAATHGTKEPLLTDDAVGETRSVAAASSRPASCFDCFASLFLRPSPGRAHAAYPGQVGVSLVEADVPVLTTALASRETTHSDKEDVHGLLSDHGANIACDERVAELRRSLSSSSCCDSTGDSTRSADMHRQRRDPSPGSPKSRQDANASMSAWRERKKQQREGRMRRNLGDSGPGSAGFGPLSSSTVDTHGFLSTLPEVTGDVAYRFSFTVMGLSAVRVVEAACSDKVAHWMCVPPATASSKGVGPQDYRCFAKMLPAVKSGTDGRIANRDMFTSDVPKMAKLMFTPIPYNMDVPVCWTRFEALSSGLVYALVVNPRPGEDSFQKQLNDFEVVVNKLHRRAKPLRPSRAVLLLCHPPEVDTHAWAMTTQSASLGLLLDGDSGDGGDRDDGEGDEAQKVSASSSSREASWEEKLADYEFVESNLCKFGPVSLKDEDGLHGVFSKIALSRILRAQESGGDESDGSQESDAPPNYEAERDPDDELSGRQLEDDNAGLFGDSGRLTDLRMQSPYRHSWLSALERGAA